MRANASQVLIHVACDAAEHCTPFELDSCSVQIKSQSSPKKVAQPKPKVEDGIFGTSGGIGFTKENELFVGRVAMLGFAGNSKEEFRNASDSKDRQKVKIFKVLGCSINDCCSVSV
ncbi:hypothetical protein Ancab_037333 [Ancistrocladus abbreviatus]